MYAETLRTFYDYVQDSAKYNLDLIRGEDPRSFTRYRQISVTDLIYQMLNRKGGSQWSDIMDFYQNLGKQQPVTETAFYLARKKFNPEAIRVMSNEFIANFYDNEADSFKKWNGNLVLAVDGSKITLPDTNENASIFGRINSSTNPIKNQSTPVGGLLSTLHDCLNNTFLDVQFGPCKTSEQTYAAQHIETYCESYLEKAIFTFDRGYPSMRLIDQLTEKKQFFLFRVSKVFLKSYMDQVPDGEERILEVKLDRLMTNMHRNDLQFRQHLMNTSYRLRFTKIRIGKEEQGEDSIEYLISNLPMEEYTIEDLKELYHLRWAIETSYNRLKNRMKLEDFSGFKAKIIYQDIYADIWLYNLISLKIIEMNDNLPLEQKQEGEYGIKRNFNKAVGIMKKMFIKTLVMMENENIENSALQVIEENLMNNVVWIKKDRTYSRKRTTTPSAMSYKKSY